MTNKIKGTRFDPQDCPICGQRLKSGKQIGAPEYRWVCTKCDKPFSLSDDGCGDEIVEVRL